MTIRARRAERGAVTDEEWLWLIADPGHNPFLGFCDGRAGHATSSARLAMLWEELEPEIRRLWRENPPAELPYGHPAANTHTEEDAPC
jgi:hypothetical protein